MGHLSTFDANGALKTSIATIPAHTHNAATDLTGQVPAANGGTGQDFSSGAGIVQFNAGTASLVSSIPPKASQSTKVTVANTTTATSLLSGTIEGSLTFAANSLEVGDVIRGKIWGIQNTHSTPGNITALTSLGGTTLGATSTLGNSASLVNRYFHIVFDFTVISTGAGGTLEGQILFFWINNTGTAFGYGSQNTSTITINTTISNALDVTFQYSVANANNNINADGAVIEHLKAA